MAKRTTFLRVLCGLSGFSAMYGMLSGASTALSPPEVDAEYLEQLYSQLDQFTVPIEGFKEMVHDYYRNLSLNMGNFGASNFLFSGIQFVGVMLMYRLNRIGFPLYVLAQLGMAFSSAYFGIFNTFGQIVTAFNLIWSLIWIGMYATQLKYFFK